jgi:hypothetical protein
MKSKLQRVVPLLGVVVGGLALLAPSASATRPVSQNDPGQVAAKLGSADPREHSQAGASAGLVPTLLGSQDPRDTASVAPTAALANVTIPAPSIGGSYAPSIVASLLGSPDPRESAARTHKRMELRADSFAGDFMFRDYFRGMHWNNSQAALSASSGRESVTAGLVASRLGSPDPRDTAGIASGAAIVGKR